MKGTIVLCLKELVEENHGRAEWRKILASCGFKGGEIFLANQNVPDERVLDMVQATCKVLGITLAQAADAFGDCWVNSYAPRTYRSVFGRYEDARSFILGMDDVHQMTTRTMPDARPPRFEYEWQDDSTLLMSYRSHRDLIDLAIGLVKAVGVHFGEKLTVSKVSDSKMKIVFE